MRIKILQQAAFVLIFLWAHQYLPVDGSIIGTRIIAVDWVHQYLPVDDSVIGTHIMAVNWVHQYLPVDGSIIGTHIIAVDCMGVPKTCQAMAALLVHKALKKTYNINITYSTNTKLKSSNNGNINAKQWLHSDKKTVTFASSGSNCTQWQ